MFETRGLPTGFGVELLDANLGAAIASGHAREAHDDILRLYRDHRLLVLRGQQLDIEALVEVAEWLGPISCQGDRLSDASDKIMHISNRTADGVGGDGALLLHSDFCYLEHPLKALLLYGLEIPGEGGDTLIAHAGRAYRALPEPLRAQIASLHAVHVYDNDNDRGDQRFRLATSKNAESNRRPVVWEHPETGELILYVNRLMTDHIEGLSAAASEELLDDLIRYVQADSNVYAHRWQVGDLLIWDNRLLQHGRAPFGETQGRTLRRVPVSGEPG
jgi:taurine dioxygenase